MSQTHRAAQDHWQATGSFEHHGHNLAQANGLPCTNWRFVFVGL